MNTIILNDPKYALLSNYSNHRIMHNIGRSWNSVSHYYHGQKFCYYYTNSVLIETIYNATTPQEAEILGTMRYPQPKYWWQKYFFKNQYYLFHPQWNSIKLKVMKDAILAKVVQHIDARETLVATANKTLIVEMENTFWGINKNGQGENHLGKIFMDIRDSMMKDGQYDELLQAPIPLWMQLPDHKHFYGSWRQGIEETYYLKFATWYDGLSEEGKKRYQAKYPQPETWYFYERDDL